MAAQLWARESIRQPRPFAEPYELFFVYFQCASASLCHFDGQFTGCKLAAKVCKEVNPEISVFEGRICSGDQFISDKSVKDAIISEFGGFAVEMEGAAIGQAAYLNHIPFLVVRAISDKADGSAHMDYAEFEMAAIEHSVKLTVRMIQEL